MGLVSSTMPGGAIALGETIKKAATWLLSLSLTIFLGLLSIQTAVNADADSAGLRTIKFVLSSIIPVTGGALSESMTTLTSSLKLLKSSVGMYGVLALGVSALPLVLELLLWRFSLYLATAVGELFGVKEGINILKCADCVLATLVGIILFTASLFIISLAVVTNC
jgi:stage III sporulation protein AE